MLARDPAAPRLTYYDDAPGPTRGERIELSARVLDNWVAKCANALMDGLGAEPGALVRLSLPAAHWRTAYWALATWLVGGTVDLRTGPNQVDVLVTTDPGDPDAARAAELVVVRLAALARSAGVPLPAGAMDEARELATFGDHFDPPDPPAADRPAMLVDGERIGYGELVAGAGWPPRSRVLLGGGPSTVLRDALAAWAGDGSVLLIREADPTLLPQRLAQEGVTVQARPAPGR